MTYLLHQLLGQAAERFPDQDALCYKGQRLTYAQLHEQSDRLAATLAGAGIQRGDRVGIYLEKSLPAVVAMLGILKAGAAYVPLDAAAPRARIAFIIQNCAMKALVSTAAAMTALQTSDADALVTLQGVIVTDETAIAFGDAPMGISIICWPEMLATDLVAPEPALIENDLAYILYTSGSTGAPKGVMISHRAALTFVNWAHETFQVQPSDRLSNHAPFHFDLSIFDLYVAIKAGATVVLVPPAFSVFPRNLADFIAQEAITIWYSVPSALTRLVLHGQLERHVYPQLRTVLFAGEVFPTKYLRQLMTLLPEPRYFNLFGPTETNVCTYYEVPPLAAEQTQPISIGKACANTETFVLNEQNKLVSAGQVGELCVRGPSLMTGYWGLPARTAQSLIPFTRHLALRPERIYRTGDLVREESDGNYTYLGRCDNMIKSRGYRIELGEIETVLYSHPDVAEAAVVPIPDEEIGNRILAFVSLHKGQVLKPRALAAYCATKIPEYMIPHAFELCDSLPKTSTGKVDKTQLKEATMNHDQ